jgi:16S rRNA (uracil1498-N3)-methyltransferase
MHLFYVPDISETTVLLPEDEAKHCSGVLRLGEGQSITLTDGKGFFYEATIQSVTRNQVKVNVIDKKEEPRDRTYKLHMGIAPTKNIGRFEWYLEKVTEIGIDEITPLIAHNSERKDVRTDRLEKIIISAMKQSLKASKPKLNPAISLNEFLGNSHSGSQLFIAHCASGNRMLLKDAYESDRDTVILIGPEGDFTPQEVDRAIGSGFKVISLGNSRLRTETAGIVACHSLYMLNLNSEVKHKTHVLKKIR